MKRSIILLTMGLMLAQQQAGALESLPQGSDTTARGEQTQGRALSLEDCIRLARERNLELKSRALATEQGKIQAEARRNDFLPTLSAAVGQNFSFGRSQDKTGVYVDRSSASTSLSIGANLTLFSGMQRLYDLKAARLDAERAFVELDQAREDLGMQVVQHYFSWLLATQVTEATKRQRERTAELLAYTQGMVKAGRWAADRLAEVQAQLATEALREAEAASAEAMARLDLTQSIEAREPVEIERLEVSAELPPSALSLPTGGDIYATALASRADVRASALALRSAEYAVRSARSGYYPSLTLGVGYGNSYYYQYGEYAALNQPFSDQWQQNGRSYIGLNLNIPIFDAFRTKGRIQMAKVGRVERQMALELTKKRLEKQIAQAREQALLAHGKIDVARGSFEASRETLRLVEAKLKAGQAAMNEYSEAKTRYLIAEIEMLKARYDFAFKMRLLQFYLPNLGS